MTAMLEDSTLEGAFPVDDPLLEGITIDDAAFEAIAIEDARFEDTAMLVDVILNTAGALLDTGPVADELRDEDPTTSMPAT